MTDEGILIAALAVGLGAASCFAGQRLFAVLLAVGGFAAGFAVASTVAPVLLGGRSDALTVLGAGVLGGLLGAFLVRAFFNAAVMLAFAAVGGWVGAAAATALGVPHLTVPALAMGGILAAVAAAILQAPRWLVVGVTSLAGAGAIVVGGSIALGRVDPEPLASAAATAAAALDPSQPLLVLLSSLLGGQWLTALTRPVELVAAQPVLVMAVALLAAAGIFVQGSMSGLLPRPRVARSA